jgi:hypothetical protein
MTPSRFRRNLSRLVLLALMGSLLTVAATAAPTPDLTGTSNLNGVPVSLEASVGGFQSGFYLPINDVVMAQRGGVRVVANGNLALSFVDSSFSGALDADDEIDNYRAAIGLNGALTVELAARGRGRLSGEMVLATLPLTPFPVGPNVVVSPFVQVRLILSGSTDADARVSMVAPFRVSAAFAHDDQPSADVSSAPHFAPEIGLPEVSGNFTGTIALEVTTSFLTTIEMVPVGGPVLATRLGASLAINTRSGGWTLDGVGEIGGGWVFPDLTGFPSVPDKLPVRHPVDPWRITGGRLPPPGASTRWSKALDVNGDDESGAALLTGSEVVVVSSDDYPFLGSIGTRGALSWQGKSTDVWAPKTMAQADNGDLLVAGGDADEIRVQRYTRSGDPLWRTTMTVPGARVRLCPPQSRRCDAIVATPSRGAILSGQVEHVNGVKRPIFAEIDERGRILWSSEVEMGAGSTNPVVRALARTRSGEILAVGSVDYSNAANTLDAENALILRLDGEGRPMRALAVGGGKAGAFESSEGAHQVAMFPDGSYVLAGDMPGSPGPRDVWLASFGAGDTMRWSAAYQRPPGANSEGNQEGTFPTGLAPLANQDLLVSGYVGQPNKDGWILRINLAGMPIWMKSYSTPEDDVLADIVALPDGLVAFGDTVFTEPNRSYQDLWLLRTNVDGMLHFRTGNGFDAENTDVHWRRVMKDEHRVQALAPQRVAVSTLLARSVAFTVNPASAVVEDLTD